MMIARRISVVRVMGAFSRDWAGTPDKRQLALAMLAIAGVMTSVALYRPLLPALGGLSLLVAVFPTRLVKTSQ